MVVPTLVNHTFWKQREAMPIAFTFIQMGFSSVGTIIAYKATRMDLHKIHKQLERSNRLKINPIG